MKPSLPRFIYFTTEHGQYILCTEYPFVVSQVWKFTDMEKQILHETKLASSLTPYKNVEGYMVTIAYFSRLEQTTTSVNYINKTLTEMSSFFLSRINERPMGWRRYKIEKD